MIIVYTIACTCASISKSNPILTRSTFHTLQAVLNDFGWWSQFASRSWIASQILKSISTLSLGSMFLINCPWFNPMPLHNSHRSELGWSSELLAVKQGLAILSLGCRPNPTHRFNSSPRPTRNLTHQPQKLTTCPERLSSLLSTKFQFLSTCLSCINRAHHHSR